MKKYTDKKQRVQLELVMNSPAVNIYSPKFEGEKLNEFELFMTKYNSQKEPLLQDDFNRIIAAIDKIRATGACENLFRPESKMSNGICAIPLIIKHRKKNIGTLRLYCSRISNEILIIGNGGIKKTQTTQEDPILMSYINHLIFIERDLLYELNIRKISLEDFQDIINTMEKLIFQIDKE